MKTYSLQIATLLVLVCLVIPSCSKQDKSSHEGHTHDPQSKPSSAEEGHSPEQGSGKHSDEVKLTEEAIKRHAITVTAATERVLRPTFVVPARIGFNTEAMAHVGCPLRGRVVELSARLGAVVQKGDLLATIESPELGEAQNDYLTKRILVETAGPAVELAKAAWDRAKGLYDETQGVSLTEVQRREAEYKATVASQRAAASSFAAAENKLHLLGMDQKTVDAFAKTGEITPLFGIRAVLSGSVVQRELTLGELVSPDRESLFVIADTSNLWVLADVPETRLHEVALGAKAYVTVGSSAGPRHEGKVSLVAPMVDHTTRSAQVRIELGTAVATLRPGMFAHVEIETAGTDGKDPAPVLAIPEESVQTVEGGPAVFVPVEGEENTFAKRALATGKAVGGLVPVYSGLQAGEKFVASGTFILKAELGKSSAAHDH